MLHHNEYEDFANPISTLSDDIASHLGYERKKKYSFSWFLFPLILLFFIWILSKEREKKHGSLFKEYGLLQPLPNASCELSQSTTCCKVFASYESHSSGIGSTLGLSCYTVISSTFGEDAFNHIGSTLNLSCHTVISSIFGEDVFNHTGSALGLSCRTVISSIFGEDVFNHTLSCANLGFSQSVTSTFVADEGSEPIISDPIIIIN